jgi:hypothetical protein
MEGLAVSFLERPNRNEVLVTNLPDVGGHEGEEGLRAPRCRHELDFQCVCRVNLNDGTEVTPTKPSSRDVAGESNCVEKPVHDLPRIRRDEARAVLVRAKQPHRHDRGSAPIRPDKSTTYLVLLPVRAGLAGLDFAQCGQAKQIVTENVPVVPRVAEREEEASLEATDRVCARQQIVTQLRWLDDSSLDVGKHGRV